MKPVYDITNAGPRRRFTVLTDGGPVIVHNCELALGFQGGAGAFLAMAKAYGVKVSVAEADEIKLAWREANPEVVGLWYGLDHAAVECMSCSPGTDVEVWTWRREVSSDGFGRWTRWHKTPLTWRRSKPAIALRLPSGRSIVYWTPRLVDKPTPWGTTKPALVYRSEDPIKKYWREFDGYGGLFCENAVQATARDVMAHAWRGMYAAGMNPILSVHDEGIGLLPKTLAAAGGGNHAFYPTAEDAAKAVESIMLQKPSWAVGLPIAADASAGPRYVKA